MSTHDLIMALDQGTTSSRALVFDLNVQQVASAQADFPQIYPQPGWVEHDPEAIWSSILNTAREALSQAESGGCVVRTIGITNQRETVVVWDKETGVPIYNAIVWQDRRTQATCEQLLSQGHEPTVRNKTGLLLDPYFSATKVAWILDNVDGASSRAEAGELLFGTIDTFLIWRLTGGKSHVTDETNAARTCLYNIHDGTWDEELLSLFRVPRAMLPEVKLSADDFGETAPDIFGRSIPISGVAGDQQSASFGQGCIRPGMAKATYGTGCFVLINTGHTPILSQNRLLTTRACRTDGDPVFAMEGSIFIAGAVAQWLRDELQIIADSAETEALAASCASNEGVYLVPAFTGLGAPHWDSAARGSLFGMTRQTNRAVLARAALEAVAFQTNDLIQALSNDGQVPALLRVDGGMSQNNWLMQCVSDFTKLPLERPSNVETTALGAAMLAGLRTGLWRSVEDILDRSGTDARFQPQMPQDMLEGLIQGWSNAVKATRFHAELSRD